MVVDEPLVLPALGERSWSFPTHLDVADYQGVAWLVDCQVRFVKLSVLVVYVRLRFDGPSLLPRVPSDLFDNLVVSLNPFRVGGGASLEHV